MNLRIRRQEAQFILVWASSARESAKEVGVPFDAEEEALVRKIRKAWKREARHA